MRLGGEGGSLPRTAMHLYISLYLYTSISHFLDNAVSNFLHYLLFCTQPAFSLNMYSGHLACLLMAIFSTHSVARDWRCLTFWLKMCLVLDQDREHARALKTGWCLFEKGLFWTVAILCQGDRRCGAWWTHTMAQPATLLVFGQCGCVKKRKGNYARSVKSNPRPALFVCVRVLSVLYYYYYWCCACAFLLY
jgi:hypothetical protein